MLLHVFLIACSANQDPISEVSSSSTAVLAIESAGQSAEQLAIQSETLRVQASESKGREWTSKEATAMLAILKDQVAALEANTTELEKALQESAEELRKNELSR